MVKLGREGVARNSLGGTVAGIWEGSDTDAGVRERLFEGFARPGARHTLDDFEVGATVPVVINDDVDAAVDALRPVIAPWISTMLPPK